MFADEIEWHGVEYFRWCNWAQQSGVHPPLFLCFFFLYCHRWDKSARGFCCLCTHRWSVLWSQCPQSILHRTSDCLCKQNLPPKWSLSLNQRHCMKICSPVFRHGKGQPSTIPFAFFNSQCTSKDDAGRKKCSPVAKDFTVIPQFFFSFIVAFCVLIIKNNNGLLSLSRAGSQAGTIRGRVIGRTGWGICWRRHGP